MELTGLLEKLGPVVHVPRDQPLVLLFFWLIVLVFAGGLSLLSARLIPVWWEGWRFWRILRGLAGDKFYSTFHELDRRLSDGKRFKRLSFVWSEFREALNIDSDRKRIYNAIDAGHFFDTVELVEKPGLRDLHSALPGVLTGLGILGTFVGLVVGLEGTQNAANFDQLRTGAAHLVGGLQIAFRTSVWGLIASLIYLIVEKGAFASTERPIVQAARKLDGLVERHTEESYLRDLGAESRKQTAALESFSTDLADAVKRATAEAFSTELAPLLQDLTQAVSELGAFKQKESTDALKAVVDTLSEQLSGAAGEQLRTFAASLDEAKSWQREMQTALGAVVERLGTAEQHQSRLVSETQGAIAQIGPLLEQVQGAATAIARSADDVQTAGASQREMVQSVGGVLEQVHAAAGAVRGVLQECSGYIDNLREATAAQLGVVREGREAQQALRASVERMADLGGRLAQLQEEYSGLLALQETAVTGFRDVLEVLERERSTMREVTSQLQETSGSLDSAAQHAEGVVGQAAELARQTQADSEALRFDVQRLIGQLDRTTKETAAVWEGFRDGFQRIGTDLAAQVKEFNESEREALDAVLRKFDEYLSQLTTRMKGSIDGLGDIVDDLIEQLEGLRTAARG